MADKRKNPSAQIAWGYYNMGLLLGVERTRKGAIAEVEHCTMEKWRYVRDYMEVHKVLVTPIAKEAGNGAR